VGENRDDAIALQAKKRGSLFEQEQPVKVGIKAKRILCGWDNDCFYQALFGEGALAAHRPCILVRSMAEEVWDNSHGLY
jgi:hypothetical protein